MTPDALKLRHEPAADCARYDNLRPAPTEEMRHGAA
jgi:hypothetical protein